MVPVRMSVVEALGLMEADPESAIFLAEEKLAVVCKVPEPMPIVFDALPRFESLEMVTVPDWICVLAVYVLFPDKVRMPLPFMIRPPAPGIACPPWP